MKKRAFDRWFCIGMACVLMAAALCMPAAAYAITEDTVIYHTDTTASDGLTYETFFAEKNGVSQRGYLFTCSPDGSALPIVTYGTHLYGRETASTMASAAKRQLSENGVRVVGGINGDFFSMQTGIPIGVMMQDGQILTSDAGASALGIRADGTYMIGVPSITAVLRRDDADNGTALELPIAHINKYPAVWGAYLCTPALGTTTHSTEAGTEYVFRAEEGSFSVGGTVRAVLTEIRENSKNSVIPEDGFVIYLHPGCTYAAEYRVLAAGDTVTVNISADSGWEDAAFALGGGDILIEDGTVYTDGFSAEHAKIANPRTAVGYTADGALLFFAADGRTSSAKGLTLAELAETMASFGCVGALNLDGGGSTTVLVRADNGSFSVTNLPSDGTERKISNVVLFLDDTVGDGIPYFAEITPESPLLYRGASVDLDIALYDKSRTPVNTDGAQVTWSAFGGTIDENGCLTPDAGAKTVSVSAQIRIPATEDGTDAATEYLLYAEETVYCVDTLDAITADASALTVPFGAVSDPITVYGVWSGQRVCVDASDVQASFADGDEYGLIDASLQVHSTDSADATAVGFPTRMLVLSVTDEGGKTHTVSIPVTFGAAPVSVMQMEERLPSSVFRTNSTGRLSRVSDNGRNGTTAVSFTATEIAPITTPAAAHPVKRIDLYLKSDALPGALYADLLCDGEVYTLPWTVSDDFTRIGGWMRLSLDTTAIAADGIRAFEITALLRSDTRFHAIMDDLTYFYGDVLPTFTDTLGSWAHDSIEAVFRMGVVSGITNSDGTYRFAPTSLLTRAEFAVMIAKFMALPVTDAVPPVFSDADAIPAWAIPYITAVTDAGYMRGKGTGEDVRFAAGDTMTRAEVMQVLGALLPTDADAVTAEDSMTAFADDAQIPDWARDNIAAVVRAGIVTGFDDNTIRPTASITRAEIAALLARVHEILG